MSTKDWRERERGGGGGGLKSNPQPSVMRYWNKKPASDMAVALPNCFSCHMHTCVCLCVWGGGLG